MKIFLVFNDLATSALKNKLSGIDLLICLHDTHKKIVSSIKQDSHPNITTAFPYTRIHTVLPNGQTISQVIDLLKKSKKELVARSLIELINRAFVYNADPIDDSIELTNTKLTSPAIQLAYINSGILLSLAVPDWHVSDLTIVKNGISKKKILNFYKSNFELIDYIALHKFFPSCILPIYEDPGHHNPKSPKFNQKKSHIPTNAELLFKHSHDENTTTWWTKCTHNFYHRFQGTYQNGVMVVHWNGTTNPLATKVISETNVPKRIIKFFKNSSIDNCGCKQL